MLSGAAGRPAGGRAKKNGRLIIEASLRPRPGRRDGHADEGSDG